MIKQVVTILIGCSALLLAACNNSTDSSDNRTEGEASAGAPLSVVDNSKQQLSCGTEEAMSKFYAANPLAYDEAMAARVVSPAAAKAIREHALKNAGKAISNNPTYIIPVVFHVYGTTFNGKSVNDSIIEDALFKTNEDIQGQANDWNQIVSQFVGVKQALSIEFRLAKIDPNGNATTGIKYYAKKDGFGNGSGYDSQIQADAWDNYKYMNVYIQNDLYNDGTTNNSGVAWYPNTSMSNANTARVVYNGAYLGTNTDENFRSVLTHEFGHWLDLIHTFEGGCSQGNENYCSSTGDNICDTPQVDTSSTHGNNCLGQLTNAQNFMHYAEQYAMFTQDQVARMINALNGSARNTLWTQANLEATGTSNGGGSSSGGSSSGGSSSGGSSSGGALSNGQTVTGLAAAQGNRTGNYYIDVPSGATNLSIKISGGTGDADLYVKKGSAPTDSSYDCRPYASGNNETCGAGGTALPTSQGRFYINAKAYSAFSGVSLTASYTSGGSSSGGSSSGGSSSGGSSSGGSSSGGALSNGQTVTGLSAAASARTGNYYIDVPSGATDLSIKISGGTGDADLYVKKGSVPTDSSYDCRPYASGNNETCGAGGTALPTSAGRFYINAKAYSAFSGLSLTASYTSGGSSSGGSSSGGSSSGGSSSGGSSSGGSSSGGGLQNGVAVNASGAQNAEAFYTMNVPSGASNLKFATSGGTGDVDLYVRFGSQPTTSTYDCRPWANGNTETCDINPAQAGTYHIMLRGYNAYSGVSLVGSYNP